MNKRLTRKLSVLDPNFRNKIKDLFENMNESISLLYEVATRDEKTGLHNNKFFENILEMELEKAQRGKQKLSLTIIDIDFFRKINDKYGHINADKLLRKLAQVIQKQIRKADIAARFGGEEFFLLLPETSLERAKKLSLRLMKAVHSDSTLKKYNITVSGGITEFKKGDSKTRFKQRADKALYQAKNSGRDRFIALK